MKLLLVELLFFSFAAPDSNPYNEIFLLIE